MKGMEKRPELGRELGTKLTVKSHRIANIGIMQASLYGFG